MSKVRPLFLGLEATKNGTGFEKIVVNYGTDIPNLKGDHKRYLYGPGSILVAHSDHEHLTVSELEAAVQDYIKLIEHSLR
jgi:acetylornithine deacetylase